MRCPPICTFTQPLPWLPAKWGGPTTASRTPASSFFQSINAIPSQPGATASTACKKFTAYRDCPRSPSRPCLCRVPYAGWHAITVFSHCLSAHSAITAAPATPPQHTHLRIIAAPSQLRPQAHTSPYSQLIPAIGARSRLGTTAADSGGCPGTHQALSASPKEVKHHQRVAANVVRGSTKRACRKRSRPFLADRKLL